jgi:hypothetical protein
LTRLMTIARADRCTITILKDGIMMAIFAALETL